VAAVAAAVMSTVDSQQMVLSSAIVRDFYGRFLGREKSLTEERYVQISRWSVLITGILALLFAIYAKAGVFVIVSFAWGGLGSAFGPVVILSVFWKRMTRAGAIAGMFSGFLVTIVWRLTPALKALVYEAVPAVLVSIGAIILVSLMTTPPAADRVDADFESMRPRYKRASLEA
jgi:Na+/proline symporter